MNQIPSILIFDIGKTNKKIILFDINLNVIYEKEEQFDEVLDDDGFACDNIEKIESWIDDNIKSLVNNDKYDVKAVNFSTYGASLMYLDEEGNKLTPLYNYLKKIPAYIVDEHYSENEGQNEFSRKTASPPLEFLNSGLQIKWLKKEKPEIFSKVYSVLHFPQYLSYNYTNKIVSEPTSVGCHTAMWDFDNSCYHKWIKELDINIPEPISNSTLTKTTINGKKLKVGTGIHDSSAALIPYLYADNKEFILISTGTWCITMNPFNDEKLSQEELEQDCLCFLTSETKQVKSSRFYMGYIHEVNTKRLSEHFKLPANEYKYVKYSESLILNLKDKYGNSGVFFKNEVPHNYIDEETDFSQFESFEEAYHQFMIALTRLSINSIKLVIPQFDSSSKIYITGGFAKNDIYVNLLSKYFKNKKIYTSEIDNASALGAAVIISDSAPYDKKLKLNLGFKEQKANINPEKFNEWEK